MLPATQARKQFFKILEDIDKPNKTYTITLGGRPKAAIISFDEYERWLETLEVLKDTSVMREIKKADEGLKKGEYVTLTDILAKEGFVTVNKLSKKHEVSTRRKQKSLQKFKKASKKT